MAIYYLLSGCHSEKGYQGEIINYLRNDLIEKNKITFFSSSPSNYEENDRYFKINIAWLNEIGIRFNHYVLIDNRLNTDQILQYIRESQVIFLMGGNPITQIDFIRQNNLIETLRRYNEIIIGVSAGAINMALKSLYSKDDKDIKKTEMVKGMGLVDVTVEPHFNINNLEFLETEIFPQSDDVDIYGIPDDSGIKIENDNVTYIGKVYKIKDRKVSLITDKDLNKTK